MTTSKGGLAAAAACLLLAAAPAARADILRLENGRVLHGTVDRGHVDEEALKIQLFSTGGTVKVRWEHLITEDRDRWQVDIGLKESEEAKELKVDAHKVLFVLRAETQYGLVLNPEALDGGPNAEVRLMVKGKVLTYPRGQIAKVDPARVDLPLVYTSEQAYEIRRDEIRPNNGPTHFDLAEYARLVGAYERAKEHYLLAKDDEIWRDTPQGKLVESRLATLEILLRNQGLQLDINGVKLRLLEARSQRDFARAARIYLDAVVEMTRLAELYPDPKLQKEFKLPDLGRRVMVERRKFFEKRLPTEMYNRVRRVMLEKAREQREKDIPPTATSQERAMLQMKGTFEGAKQYAQRQVREELWAGILKDVGAGEWLEELAALAEKDPDKVTEADRKRAKVLADQDKALKEDLAKFWEDRSKNGFMVTSYGYGTFIVTGNTLKLSRKPPQRSGGRSGAGQKQSQAVDVVKTADQWWEGASGKERADWLLSYCAEKAGLFDPFRTWEDPCDACAGLGYKKSVVASTGEEEAERCRICNGAKVIRKVKWR